jgi:hypothetical protein
MAAAAVWADMEPAVAGPRPSSNVWRRSRAMEALVARIRGISRILRHRPTRLPYGADQFSVATCGARGHRIDVRPNWNEQPGMPDSWQGPAWET